MAYVNGDAKEPNDPWVTENPEVQFDIADDDNDERPTSIVLQHPTVPFVPSLDEFSQEAVQIAATEYFERAIELDPHHAPAYAGLSDAVT